MITSLDQLAPDTRRAASAWLEASVGVVDADLRAGVRDELTIALCESLDTSATPADLAAVIERLGPIEAEDADSADADPRRGTWHGIPYDWRPPTAERVRAALWDPADPRLFRPRAFGAGWDLNFGALAVRSGLIEPDAEDEPFASTPNDAFALAAVIPALGTVAVAAHYAVRGRSLPAILPQHWDAAGRPDRWISKGAAATTDLAVSVGATALGLAAAASRAHGGGRAARLAIACAVAGVAKAVTVTRTARGGGWWVGPGLIASIVLPAGAVLVGLARAGRDAERRRDLGA